MLGSTTLEVVHRPELGLSREVSTGCLDDVGVGHVEIQPCALWLAHMPRSIDEDLDAVELRIAEVHRPRIAVAERQDLRDPGVGFQLALQRAQIVQGAPPT